MKKILIILPNTNGAGDGQVILNLLNSVPENTFNVDFFTHSIGTRHEEFKLFGKVYHSPFEDNLFADRFARRLIMPLFSRLNRIYFRILIKYLSPDLLYLNTVNDHSIARVALSSKVNLLLHIHEMDFVVANRMSPLWVKTLFQRTDLIISCAKAASVFYQDIYNVSLENCREFHGPVNIQRLMNESKLDYTSQIADGPLIIGTSGSIMFRKGTDMLIKALGIVRNSVPSCNIQMHWIGTNPNASKPDVYFESITNLIVRENLTEYVHFLPHSTDLKNFYRSLDIFVLPSRMEAFPLVILEAMLFEKPVVAMDVGGVREVVDSETGYLVKDRSPEGLAEGILYMLNNRDQWSEMGKKGKKKVMENFEASIQAPKWIQIIEDAIQG